MQSMFQFISFLALTRTLEQSHIDEGDLACVTISDEQFKGLEPKLRNISEMEPTSLQLLEDKDMKF